MTERPHSHTVLVVGSSRTAHGFLPESVPLSPDQERPILWFNFSHIGYGPVMNCLTLHRLIHDGIQPNCIVLEIMPAFFVKEDSRFQVGHINARELLILNRYSPFLSAEKAYLWTRLDKLRAIQPFREPFTGVAHLELFGGWTAFDHQPALPEKRDERLAAQRDSIAGYLRNVHARPGAIRALHDSISICRENGIQLILLRTPEGPVARSWYDAEKLAAFDRWIQSLAEAKAIPVVDARDWLVEDDFKDSHHPNRNGAITFTARLLRELTPMLDR